MFFRGAHELKEHCSICLSYLRSLDEECYIQIMKHALFVSRCTDEGNSENNSCKHWTPYYILSCIYIIFWNLYSAIV